MATSEASAPDAVLASSGIPGEFTDHATLPRCAQPPSDRPQTFPGVRAARSCLPRSVTTPVATPHRFPRVRLCFCLSWKTDGLQWNVKQKKLNHTHIYKVYNILVCRFIVIADEWTINLFLLLDCFFFLHFVSDIINKAAGPVVTESVISADTSPAAVGVCWAYGFFLYIFILMPSIIYI